MEQWSLADSGWQTASNELQAEVPRVVVTFVSSGEARWRVEGDGEVVGRGGGHGVGQGSGTEWWGEMGRARGVGREGVG